MNKDILDRIQDYLRNRGLFNPEEMNHDHVRSLILDCRTEIERLREIEWMYKELE